MAAIKSYTDLPQSKKLAEILPPESADMYWYLATKGNPKAMFNEEYNKYGDFELPCWSLASLLGVLPYCPDLSKHTDGKWYITTYPNDVHTCLMAYDNPVDACVVMIEKLHQLKML